jgi:hypothetical protein
LSSRSRNGLGFGGGSFGFGMCPYCNPAPRVVRLHLRAVARELAGFAGVF